MPLIAIEDLHNVPVRLRIKQLPNIRTGIQDFVAGNDWLVHRHNGLFVPRVGVGGTGVKGLLLDGKGKPISERERFDTPQPATPTAILAVLDAIAAKLTGFDRVSVGFPGVVKRGATLTAHNLHPKWVGFELEK